MLKRLNPVFSGYCLALILAAFAVFLAGFAGVLVCFAFRALTV